MCGPPFQLFLNFEFFKNGEFTVRSQPIKLIKIHTLDYSTNECYLIGHETSRFHVNMTQRRAHAASIVVGNRLWVSGGCCDANSSRTSEYVSIFEGINSEVGPDLPFSIYFHAIVSLNDTTAMLIGGDYSSIIHSYTTYYYSHFTQRWTRGPDLLQNSLYPMGYHLAGIITDQITMEEHVVAFGYQYLTLEFWTNPHKII